MPIAKISTDYYPRYFVMGDDQPGRILAVNRLPQVLRSGGWENYGDTWKFLHDAQPVGEDEFFAAVEEWMKPPTDNAFCHTGVGGGQDNSCSSKQSVSQSIPTIKFRQVTDPAEFKKALSISTRPENHSEHSDEELKSSRMFLSHDGKVGFLITKDGDFGNLFNNGGPKGAGQAALVEGVKQGAKTLDCYDGFLPHLYSKFGFKPSASLRFNEEYAPPGWEYNRLGKPDVIFMHYDGGDRGTIEKRVGSFKPYSSSDARRVDSWDEGKSISTTLVVNRGHGERPRVKLDVRQPDPTGGAGGLHRESVDNAFCPTGEGGGIDPTCSPSGISSTLKEVKSEETTPPPPGRSYTPSLTKDRNDDGITDAARVGVPAMSVPPPPPIGKLPNLTPEERAVETKFIHAYEAAPDRMAADFRSLVHASTKPGDAPTFGTDDAKALTDVWSDSNPIVRSENRATLNTALHQTANAIAKRAFLQELDSLKEGDELLVTVGGCGAGKGYALQNVPKALEMKERCKAVWDSAGDQNATENPWVQYEAEKRGLKVNYVYVHADPYTQWADPERGVVKRASNPNDGRMVDAKVFADSYALGAKNHQSFYEANKDNPNAKFVFLGNRGGPKELSSIPTEALGIDRKRLAKYAVSKVLGSGAPERVIKGALIGQRIWGES